MENGNDNEKVYLYIPYARKDEVKALGARWDKEQKLWYSTRQNIESSDLKKYLEKPKRVYYLILYDEKEEAKKLGAKWDKEESKWYAMSDNEAFHEKYKDADLTKMLVERDEKKGSNRHFHTFSKSMK